MPLSLPEQKALPIVSANGANFGFEITALARDSLDRKVDQQLTLASAPLNILDIGGATGYRAGQFARRGHAVTVIDICDHTAAIDLRNSFNSLQHSPIKFLQADASALDEQQAYVLQQKWQLIHARRVIHWMPFNSVAHLVAQLPQMADGRGCNVALCFQTAKETPGTLAVVKTANNHFYHHAPQDVLGLMDAQGMKIIEHGRGENEKARSYKIFAQIPA